MILRDGRCIMKLKLDHNSPKGAKMADRFIFSEITEIIPTYGNIRRIPRGLKFPTTNTATSQVAKVGESDVASVVFPHTTGDILIRPVIHFGTKLKANLPEKDAGRNG